MALNNEIALFDFGGFEGGLNKESDPFTVAPNESPEAMDVNFLQGGSVRRRKGYTMAVQWGFIPPDPLSFEAFGGFEWSGSGEASEPIPGPLSFESLFGFEWGFDVDLQPGKLVPPGFPVVADLHVGEVRRLTVVHADPDGHIEVAADLGVGDVRVLTIVHADVKGHINAATDLESDL